MTEITRFGVSTDKKLLKRFDTYIKDKGYPTRSKAIADLIRKELIQSDWDKDRYAAGVITLVYNHHSSNITQKLTDAQHDFYKIISSSQHVHMDHNNCLEIIIARGKAKIIEELQRKLASLKGIKQCKLTVATTGKDI